MRRSNHLCLWSYEFHVVSIIIIFLGGCFDFTMGEEEFFINDLLYILSMSFSVFFTTRNVLLV